MNKNEKEISTVNETGKFNTSKYFGADFMTTGNHIYALPKSKNFADPKTQYCYDTLSGMKCNLIEQADIDFLKYLNQSKSFDDLFNRIEELTGGSYEEWVEGNWKD